MFVPRQKSQFRAQVRKTGFEDFYKKEKIIIIMSS